MWSCVIGVHGILAILQETTTVGSGEPAASAIPWGILGIAAAFGAVGGIVYELIALQGNIEWPHRPSRSEVPAAAFAYATVQHVYDLGIIARLIVGAAAAIIVYWVLPMEPGLRLVAASLIAGSAGTAVFRSLQDRMLATLNAEKVENLAAGLTRPLQQLQDLQEQIGDTSRGAARADAGEIQSRIAEIRGGVAALVQLAGD